MIFFAVRSVIAVLLGAAVGWLLGDRLGGATARIGPVDFRFAAAALGGATAGVGLILVKLRRLVVSGLLIFLLLAVWAAAIGLVVMAGRTPR